MRIKISIIVLCFAVLAVAGCHKNAKPVMAAEWADITVSAVGMGAPPKDAVNPAQAKLMACRAAKADALRRLLEQVYGVQVDSQTTVRDFVTENDEIRTKTEGFIRNARIVKERSLDDGSCEVTLELHLAGLAEIIYH